MTYTVDELCEIWKELISTKALICVNKVMSPSDRYRFRVYLSLLGKYPQVIVKEGDKFYSYGLMNAKKEVAEYQIEHNIREG